MKKLVLAVAIMGIFALYSLGIRHNVPVIGKPSSLVSNNTSDTTSNSSGNNPPPNNTGASSSAVYKDGTYTGSVADAYYGNVQVSATVSGGKLTDVTFLQYPNTHATSVVINQQAMPYLKQEAIAAQSANVQIVSGATFTSQAFQQSLQAALSQA
jgi:uncharacterized protein with FMN-binding domain